MQMEDFLSLDSVLGIDEIRIFLTAWLVCPLERSRRNRCMSPKTRLGDEERRPMDLVPAPAVRLMKRRVLSRPGVNSLMSYFYSLVWRIFHQGRPKAREKAREKGRGIIGPHVFYYLPPPLLILLCFCRSQK